MIKIGLTGGVATGKSTVGKLLRQKGIKVISSDELAHQAMAPGGSAYQQIVAEFGWEIMMPDGKINRKFLGEIVFNDVIARKKLEQMVHPIVIMEIQKAIENCSKQGSAFIVVEVPLLFEVGLINLFDYIWVVSSSLEHQLYRLNERDGLTEQEALKRITAQMPLKEKEERADAVIINNDSIDFLEKQVSNLLRTLE